MRHQFVFIGGLLGVLVLTTYSEQSYSWPTTSTGYELEHRLRYVSRSGIPRTDLLISPHFATFLDVLMEGGSRADLAQIQNLVEAARAPTYFIHR